MFREEFDDWAILFDPDSGDAFGLNPVAAFVWKRLDGAHTEADILVELSHACEAMPEEAPADVHEFIEDLVKRGFAGHEVATG